MKNLTKQCSKCRLYRDIEDFYHSTNKNNKRYPQSQCKNCICLQKKEKYKPHPNVLLKKEQKKERKLQYYLKNKERLDSKKKEYNERNKERLILKKREWNERNSEKLKQQRKKWKEENKEKVKVSNKLSFERNIKRYQKYQKKWIENNRDKSREYSKKWRKKNPTYYLDKINSDLGFRLAGILRSRLRKAIKGNFKSGSAVRDLGCSISELKQWLERQFRPGMSWSNYGDWHIDHIIPLSSFDLTNRKQFKKACHWFNLRPLWASENISRGNKYV